MGGEAGHCRAAQPPPGGIPMDPTLIISGIRALIRLAAPLATQDALTRKLMVIQGQVGSSGKLPSVNSSRCSSSLTGWRRNSTRSPGSATFNAMAAAEEGDDRPAGGRRRRHGL